MAQVPPPATDPLYAAGDILVTPVADGAYEVLRVSANGRSTHVMGVRTTRPAALMMAGRATSGYQRVFLRDPSETEYHLVAQDSTRG